MATRRTAPWSGQRHLSGAVGTQPMRVAMLNFPIKAPWLGPPGWITVPPQKYGGIQWVVANLIDGLLDLGHKVVLLGAPGSPSRPGLEVVDAGRPTQIRAWLANHQGAYDVVHDHSVGSIFAKFPPSSPYVATWHLTGTARYPCNTVYISEAQRFQAAAAGAPVIRIPVNPKRYPICEQKGQKLLFLGRVSPWKGAFEAADFGTRCGCDVYIAGPTWDEPYRRTIEHRFAANTIFLGEVGGTQRLELLQRAAAVLVLSQPVSGPWGDRWVEPGATVVTEAAMSGTAVIASANGCLPEIVPGVGSVIDEGALPSERCCRKILETLPQPAEIRVRAMAAWGCSVIAARYVELYDRVLSGDRW